MSHYLRAKTARRAGLILVNAAHGLLIPLLNPIVSLLVVRWASAAVWGEFVQVLLAVQLATHVAGWGNKDYLLREFSFGPARIGRAWQTGLVSRLAVFAPLSGATFLLDLPPNRAAWIVAWCLAVILDQSYDVFVVYRKDFAFAAVVEVGGLAVQVATLIVIAARIAVDSLIVVFTLATLAKTLAYAWRYRRSALVAPEGGLRWSGRIEWRFFGLALPFFVLGLSGLLQSRIDLYAASLYLPAEQIGQYQVLTTFILYLQSAANFILTPFLKSLYRLRTRALLRASARLFLFGALLTPFALFAIHVILMVHYRFDLPAIVLPLAGLGALPIFFYLPIIYALYKSGAQATVVKINALGIAVNFAASVLLLPRLGLIGGVTAGALAQCAMAAGYWLQSRSLRETHAAALPELS